MEDNYETHKVCGGKKRKSMDQSREDIFYRTFLRRMCVENSRHSSGGGTAGI